MARVFLQNVTKKYGDVTAVNEFTLEIRDKDFFVLVGPSGCGKSTVLRLIAGLEAPTSGNIYIGDTLVNRLPSRERDIAMVFESPSYALYPHLTAYDNMATSLRFRKDLPLVQGEQSAPTPDQQNRKAGQAAREGEIRRRVERVADRLHLQGYLGRKRSELSAGHNQSVALGRAMVREPRVFLMDDPLSQLDGTARASSRIELRDLHRRSGATVIYVTHNQVEAMALGNRVGVMDNGVLQQSGTPQALFDRPANIFVAGFIGSPPMNMFRVTAESDAEGLFFSGPGFRLPVPEHYATRLGDCDGRPLVMGLRAEDIHDARLSRDADPRTVVEAEVRLREYLGSEVDLHLVVGGQEFVARVSERTDARPGQRLNVAFDTSKIHVFDRDTQRSLL
ncbi:MAG: ABC transporter ATP-binding protein [Chloroflexia bacterium]